MAQSDGKHQLTDCHSHLGTFDDALIGDMLVRAEQAGVDLIVVAGVDLASSRRAVQLAASYGPLFAAVGLHPLHLQGQVSEGELAELRALASSDPKVVAISEIGLDYEEGQASRKVQREVFRRAVRLAVALGLPVIFHDRGAHDDTFRVLDEEGGTAVGAVMHYFTGDAITAQRCLDLGCYISLGKPIIKPEHAALREVVRALPLERLLLETDAYYRAERGEGGQSEPWQVTLVAAKLAEIKGLSMATVARITRQNLLRLLGRAGRDDKLADGDCYPPKTLLSG